MCLEDRESLLGRCEFRDELDSSRRLRALIFPSLLSLPPFLQDSKPWTNWDTPISSLEGWTKSLGSTTCSLILSRLLSFQRFVFFAQAAHLIPSFELTPSPLPPSFASDFNFSQTEYDACWHDWEGSCLKSVGNPRGVPIQDMFLPQFFGRDAPLPKGHAEWALVPEDIRNQNNTYIGYSIEEECMRRTVRSTCLYSFFASSTSPPPTFSLLF